MLTALAGECVEQIFLIIPSNASSETCYRLIETMTAIPRKGEKPTYKILYPAIFEEKMTQFAHLQEGVLRKLESFGQGIAIFDSAKVVLFRFSPDDSNSFEGAVLLNDAASVSAMSTLFISLWREMELRETVDLARRELSEALAGEERAKREAQLLQDILTHDIRNYNQVTRLSAELLREELPGSPSVQLILGSMLGAIEGSTNLLERAKHLGRIVSERNAKLYPVSLGEIIDSALLLIRRTYPNKTLKEERTIKNVHASSLSDRIARVGSNPDSGEVSFYELKVEADELLEEVFANLFSNCAKYTNGDKVDISISVDEVRAALNAVPGETADYLKVTVSDRGQGIPDSEKATIFSRYLRGAKGMGLGMSIIHALVVDRYQGRIYLRNRVEGDYTQGTSIELWLRKSAT
jgi:signal transduction histidine kinase